MNTAEIERIGAEAQAEEGAQAGNALPGEATPVAANDDVLAGEFAEFLDVMAKVGGKFLPTVPQRFTHEANLDISKAAIKLCVKYGYDARKFLIGEDSTLGAWLGLGFAVGIPGYMCVEDYKVMKAREVAAAEPEGGAGGESGDGK